MDAAGIQRFARQIALPEVGADGQERLGAARVLVAGGDLAADVAARYLIAAGVGSVALVGTGDRPWPAGGAGWTAALAGVDLLVRSGFDDDAMLGVVKQLGVATVVMRANGDLVDVISFPPRQAAAASAAETPAQQAQASEGAAAVVAGTLAAAEALQALLGNGPCARARSLRLPLDGRDPQAQDMPWG